MIDLLPDDELPAAGRFLHLLVNGTMDDSLNEVDWRAVRAGSAEIASGAFTTLEALTGELL